MVRVSAKRLVLAEVQLIIGRAKSKMAKRGFTLVKQRRRAEPLTQAGRTQLRQPLDSLVKVIHLRLGQEAEAVVVPVFRYLDVRRRLRVAAEVALEKVAVHERVALILQQQFRSEIGLDVHRVVQAQSMAIGARGELRASGATAGTGLRIAVVQNVDRGVALPRLAKVVIHVQPTGQAAKRAVVQTRRAVQPVTQVPVVRALEKHAIAAPVPRCDAPVVRRLIQPTAVVREIKHRHISRVQRRPSGLDEFPRADAQAAGSNLEKRIGAIVGRQPDVLGGVLVFRLITLDVGSLDKKRSLPRAKVIGLHGAGAKVVKQPIGGEHPVLTLQRDVALGKHLTGLLVQLTLVGNDKRAFALLLERDAEPVVQHDAALIEVVIKIARLEGFDLPNGVIRRRRFGGENRAWPSGPQQQKKRSPATMHQRPVS